MIRNYLLTALRSFWKNKTFSFINVLGLALGQPPDRMWMVGPLHFGQSDHAIHVLLGIVFLAGGLFTKKT